MQWQSLSFFLHLQHQKLKSKPLSAPGQNEYGHAKINAQLFFQLQKLRVDFSLAHMSVHFFLHQRRLLFLNSFNWWFLRRISRSNSSRRLPYFAFQGKHFETWNQTKSTNQASQVRHRQKKITLLGVIPTMTFQDSHVDITLVVYLSGDGCYSCRMLPVSSIFVTSWMDKSLKRVRHSLHMFGICSVWHMFCHSFYLANLQLLRSEQGTHGCRWSQ